MTKYIKYNDSIMKPTEQRIHANTGNIDNREFQIQNKTMAGLAKQYHDKLMVAQSDIDQLQQRLHVPASSSHGVDVNKKYIKQIAKLYKIGKSLSRRDGLANLSKQSGGGDDGLHDPFIMILKKWEKLIREMERNLNMIRETRERLENIEKERQEEAKNKAKREESAILIQKNVRKNQAKQKATSKKETIQTEHNKEKLKEQSAIRIQAKVRQKQARKKVDELKKAIIIQSIIRKLNAQKESGNEIIERLNQSPVMVMFMFEYICIKRYIDSLPENTTRKPTGYPTGDPTGEPTKENIKEKFKNVTDLIFINNSHYKIDKEKLKEIGIEEKTNITIIDKNDSKTSS